MGGALRRRAGRPARILLAAALPLILSAGALAFWGVPSYRNLVSIEGGFESPRGDWVLVRGRIRFRRSRRAAFLLHEASGRTVALGDPSSGAPAYRSLVFAASGNRAAWIRERRDPFGPSDFELYSLDLDGPKAVPARLPVSFPEPPELAITSDGRLVGALEETAITVLDTRTGKTLASRRLPNKGQARLLFFLDETRLRIYPRQRFEPTTPASRRVDELLELDPATGRLSVTGRVESDFPGSFLRPSAAGNRSLLLERERSRVTVRDGRTGEELALLATDGKLRSAAFLSKRRIATVVRGRENTTVVRVFSEDGRQTTAIPIPIPPGAAVLMGEPAPGRLLLALNSVSANSRRPWSLYRLDLSIGAVSASWPGLAPLDPLEFWTDAALPDPGEARRPWPILLDAKGRLVRLDPLTGRRRLLPSGS